MQNERKMRANESKMRGHECTLELKWKEYERNMNGNEIIAYDRNMKGQWKEMNAQWKEDACKWNEHEGKMHPNKCNLKGTWSVAEAPETNETTARSISEPVKEWIFGFMLDLEYWFPQNSGKR